jgi:hypothetical protein
MTSDLLACQSAINPEELAYWYLRLNGFLTTANFVVHPEEGAEPRTEIDILGVRFPHRAELLTNSMVDEPLFSKETVRLYVVIAEVTKNRCKLNGPWRRAPDQNLQRVLAAIGAIPKADWEPAAQALYDTGAYDNEHVHLTLCCFGRSEDRTLRRDFPLVPQILWPDVAQFIHNRFQKYLLQKQAHERWDVTGKWLYALAANSEAVEAFTVAILNAIENYQEP